MHCIPPERFHFSRIFAQPRSGVNQAKLQSRMAPPAPDATLARHLSPSSLLCSTDTLPHSHDIWEGVRNDTPLPCHSELPKRKAPGAVWLGGFGMLTGDISLVGYRTSSERAVGDYSVFRSVPGALGGARFTCSTPRSGSPWRVPSRPGSSRSARGCRAARRFHGGRTPGSRCGASDGTSRARRG